MPKSRLRSGTSVQTLFVDTHCHLDQYRDPRAVLSEARERRVVVVGVTETPSAFQRQLTATHGEDNYLRPALGLHPLRAARLSGSEVERFFASLGRTDYVGEIGIDRSPQGKPTEARQLQIFERILAEPRIREKVLTLHSRGAARQVVERMEQASVVGILHWYTGSASMAERALAAGLYFSINPSMLRTKAGGRLLALLPRDRVLTETDGPFCRLGSRECRPADVLPVVKALGRLWGLEYREAADQVVENLTRLHRQIVPNSHIGPASSPG